MLNKDRKYCYNISHSVANWSICIFMKSLKNIHAASASNWIARGYPAGFV